MTELQKAMARYEDARITYRKAVLASLNGSTQGEGIREAILQFKAASAELKRLRPAPSAPPPAQVDDSETSSEATGWWRRLLKAS